MTVIADAGSTKIEWVLLDNKKCCLMRLCTRGFNAAQRPASALAELISEDAPAFLSSAKGCRLIFFYGAGCIGECCDHVSIMLKELFETKKAFIDSDMLGAARALCGSKPGIACILGTGSNSCLYDGRQITANTPPMGFILGDEGSGASLGKSLLTNVFKNRFSDTVIGLFCNRYPEATKAEVISRVYRGDRPGAYLASFAPFLKEFINLPEIEALVTQEFRRFFDFNIRNYDSDKKLPINFIGSIAANFEPQLRKAAADCGYTIGRIEQAPMDSLISYHTR